MHTSPINFIQDLAIVMLIAGLMTILCHRFKQPVVLGYIVAGIIMGPYTPPFTYIQDEATIRTLATLGIIFIMFSLGLEFNLRKLGKIGLAATFAALAEIILMTAVGYALGQAFGWSFINSIFLGAMLAISSTTIIIKALEELGLKHEAFAQLIFGILILEDIFAIVILALLSSIAITGSLDTQDVVLTLGKLSSFLVVSFIFGIITIPRLLRYIAKFKSKEMLLITVLGICFGFCLLAIQLNYSVALGAFIIGAIMAESEQLAIIESLVASLRDMFSAIFFVSVGLLFNPAVLTTQTIPIIVITLAVVIGKVVSCSLGSLMTGRDGKTSMRVGMGLAQIGEFSFIIAGLGVTLNVTSSFLFPIAVVVSVITTLLTPYLIKYSDPCARYLSKLVPTKLANGFTLYCEWLHGSKPAHKQHEHQLIHRCYMQVLINLLIVMAIFFAASYIVTSTWGVMLAQRLLPMVLQTGLWTLALVLSLPCLLASYQTIKILGLILLDVKNKKGERRRSLTAWNRGMIAGFAWIILGGVVIMISLINVTLLPPVQWLLVVLPPVIVLALVFHYPIVKLYNHLQISLFDALKKSE